MEISQSGATLSGSASGIEGTVVEAGFKWGLSAGALSSARVGTYNNGSISASLSGLTAGTTYFYQAYLTVRGTGDYASESEMFTGEVKSFTASSQDVLPTWLSSYEIPANNALAVSATSTVYNGFYSHSTVSEEYGTTKAAIYNTSDSDQRIVVHTFDYDSKVQSNYSMLYDKNKKCALWVAYKYNGTEYPDKNVGRTGSWTHYDPAIPEDWQPDLSGGYSGTYDRGHQVASNDRQTTTNQNKQTFYYSNVTPQNSTLNQGGWNSMESKIQGMATNTRSNQELYVVTGPIFNGTIGYTTDASGASCAVPTGYYKCALKVTYNSDRTISAAVGCAYIAESNNASAEVSLTSIDYVETKTGLDFYANLPEDLQALAEAMTTSF